MTLSHAQPSELDALLEKLCEQTLSEEEDVRLARRLKTDATARRRYLVYLELHGALYWDHVSRNLEERETEPALDDAMILPAIRVEEEVQEREAPQLPAPAPLPKKREVRMRRKLSRVSWGKAAVILLPILLAWSAYLAFHRTAAPGTLATAVDTVWESARAPQSGEQLPKGLLFLKSGVVGIHFNSGATMIVAGPARFSVNSNNSAILQSGSVTATVPPAAHGFEIQAGNLHIVDLGTEFGVSALEDGSVHVEVFRGKVEARLGAQAGPEPSTQVLAQGQAVEVGPDAAAMYPATAHPQQFVRQEELNSRVAAAAGSRYDRWLAYSYELRRDPDLVAYYTFDKDAASSNRLSNLSAGGSQLDGTLGGDDPGARPTWASGRWGQNGALAFAPGHQRVEVPSPIGGPLDFSRGRETASSFTIAAWFLAESPQQLGAAIVAKGPSMHEQFGICFDERSSLRAWMRGETNRAMDVIRFTPSRRWQYAAEVYDPLHRELLFYVNGGLADRQSGAPDQLLESAHPVTIGCRHFEKSYFPSFVGRIDEVAIFRKALTGEDIQKMYEVGNPD